MRAEAEQTPITESVGANRAQEETPRPSANGVPRLPPWEGGPEADRERSHPPVPRPLKAASVPPRSCHTPWGKGQLRSQQWVPYLSSSFRCQMEPPIPTGAFPAEFVGHVVKDLSGAPTRRQALRHTPDTGMRETCFSGPSRTPPKFWWLPPLCPRTAVNPVSELRLDHTIAELIAYPPPCLT